MKSKTQQAREHIRKGEWKPALRICKTFRNTFTQAEKRSIEIAYECLTGKEGFYEQLGYNIVGLISVAKVTVTNKLKV